MDGKCIRCSKPAAYPVRALEVRTLHVRSLGGERRVQALGNETEGAVCEACAKAQLDLDTNPIKAVKPQLIRFGAVFAAGLAIIAATLLFVRESKQVFLLLGLAALVCGALGIYDAYRRANEKTAPSARYRKRKRWRKRLGTYILPKRRRRKTTTT